jgi:hypothetical protein
MGRSRNGIGRVSLPIGVDGFASSLSVDPERKRCNSMRAAELDEKFEAGESIVAELDLDSARRPNLEQRRVNVDFPLWMIEALDRAARKFGISRQSVIKVWLAERLKQEA